MINLKGIILEGLILTAISDSEEGTYGYEICNKINRNLNISEITIYKTLSKLNNLDYFEVKGEVVNGRNRNIYVINEKGLAKLKLIKSQWVLLSNQVNKLLMTR